MQCKICSMHVWSSLLLMKWWWPICNIFIHFISTKHSPWTSIHWYTSYTITHLLQTVLDDHLKYAQISWNKQNQTLKQTKWRHCMASTYQYWSTLSSEITAAMHLVNFSHNSKQCVFVAQDHKKNCLFTIYTKLYTNKKYITILKKSLNTRCTQYTHKKTLNLMII